MSSSTAVKLNDVTLRAVSQADQRASNKCSDRSSCDISVTVLRKAWSTLIFNGLIGQYDEAQLTTLGYDYVIGLVK